LFFFLFLKNIEKVGRNHHPTAFDSSIRVLQFRSITQSLTGRSRRVLLRFKYVKFCDRAFEQSGYSWVHPTKWLELFLAFTFKIWRGSETFAGFEIYMIGLKSINQT
jgi:hypothetical protein